MLAEPPSGRQTIVEGGEIVTDGFEISQEIRTLLLAPDPRSRMANTTIMGNCSFGAIL